MVGTTANATPGSTGGTCGSGAFLFVESNMITNENIKDGPFLGNGVTTSWPITTKIVDKTKAQVIHTNAAGIDDDTLVLDSDFSLTLNPDQDQNPGGTLTYPVIGSPLPSGEKLNLIYQPPFTQQEDLTIGGGFNPQVVENALDKNTQLARRAFEKAGRSVTIPVSDGSSNTELPTKTLRADKFLMFDSNGDPAVASDVEVGEQNTMSNVGTGTGQVFKQKSGVDFEMKTIKGGTDISVDNDADEVTINNTQTPGEINTNSNSGSGAGLVKTKVGSDTPIKSIIGGTNVTVDNNTDDITINATGGGGGGSAFKPFEVDVKTDYALNTDGTADNSSKIQAAINDALHNNYGGTLILPEGKIRLDGIETFAGNFFPGTAGPTIMKAGFMVKDPFGQDPGDGTVDPWAKEIHPSNPTLRIRGAGHGTRLILNSDDMIGIWVAAGWIEISDLIIDGGLTGPGTPSDWSSHRVGLYHGPEGIIDPWKYKPYYSDVAYPELEFTAGGGTGGRSQIILKSGTNSRFHKLGNWTWSVQVHSADIAGNNKAANVLDVTSTHADDDTLEFAAGTFSDDASDLNARVWALQTVGNYSHNLVKNVFVERCQIGWLQMPGLKAQSNVHNGNPIENGNSYWNNSEYFKFKQIMGAGFRTIEANDPQAQGCTRGCHIAMHGENMNVGIDLEAAETMTFVHCMMNEANSTYSSNSDAEFSSSIGVKLRAPGSVSGITTFRNHILHGPFEANEVDIDDEGNNNEFTFSGDIYTLRLGTVQRSSRYNCDRFYKIGGLKDWDIHNLFFDNTDGRLPLDRSIVDHYDSKQLITWDAGSNSWRGAFRRGPGDTVLNEYGPSSQGLLSFGYLPWTNGTTTNGGEREMLDSAPSGYTPTTGDSDSIAIANKRLECDIVQHASIRSHSYYYKNITAFTEFWMVFHFKINSARTTHNMTSTNDNDWVGMCSIFGATGGSDVMGLGLSYDTTFGYVVPRPIYKDDPTGTIAGTEFDMEIKDDIWHVGCVHAVKETADTNNDGIIEMWVNNTQIADLSNIQNFNIPWDRVSLGISDARHELDLSMDFGDVRFDTSDFSKSRGGL